MRPGQDRDSDRRKLALATLELISLDSRDPLDLSRVAQHAGISQRRAALCATSRADLLKLAMSEVVRRYSHRLETRDRGLRGVAGTMAGVMRYMPVTAAERAEWKMWIFFWGLAVEMPQLSAIHRVAEEEIATRLARILHAGLRGAADYPWKELAVRVMTVMHGVGLRATLDPFGWPEERQRALLESLLVPHLQEAVDSAASQRLHEVCLPDPGIHVPHPRSIDLRSTQSSRRADT